MYYMHDIIITVDVFSGTSARVGRKLFPYEIRFLLAALGGYNIQTTCYICGNPLY